MAKKPKNLKTDVHLMILALDRRYMLIKITFEQVSAQAQLNCR